jgi:N-methylhydantoinase A
VQSIVVPATATVHSAFGAVTSDLHVSTELSDLMHAPSWDDAPGAFDLGRINANFERLEEAARHALLESGARPDRMSFERSADLRLRMQVHQLTVPVDGGALPQSSIGVLLDRFERQFEELYGSGAAHKEAGVEIVSFRVRATGHLEKPQLARLAGAGSGSERRVELSDRSIYLGPTRGRVTAAVLRGDSLTTADRIDGPAVIEHPGTTIFIGPGQIAEIDQLENTVITFERQEY